MLAVEETDTSLILVAITTRVETAMTEVTDMAIATIDMSKETVTTTEIATTAMTTEEAADAILLNQDQEDLSTEEASKRERPRRPSTQEISPTTSLSVM